MQQQIHRRIVLQSSYKLESRNPELLHRSIFISAQSLPEPSIYGRGTHQSIDPTYLPAPGNMIQALPGYEGRPLNTSITRSTKIVYNFNY